MSNLEQHARQNATPEVLTSLEFPEELPTINEIRNKGDNLQAKVDSLRDKFSKGIKPEKLGEEVAQLQLAEASLVAFKDMWSAYGGEQVDAAMAELKTAHDANDPLSTASERAKDKLRTAEDAFYAQVSDDRDALYEGARNENDLRSGRIMNPDEAHDSAWDEAARRTTVEDIERARTDAWNEAADRTTQADIDRAHDEAERYRLREGEEETRIPTETQAWDEAHADNDAYVPPRGVKKPARKFRRWMKRFAEDQGIIPGPSQRARFQGFSWWQKRLYNITAGKRPKNRT